jgi:hypothetical protein
VSVLQICTCSIVLFDGPTATMSLTISFFSLPWIHAASLNTSQLLNRGKILLLQQRAQLPPSICTFRDQFSASKPPVPPIVKTMLPAAEPPNDMHHMTKNVPIHAGLTHAASLPMLKWHSYVLGRLSIMRNYNTHVLWFCGVLHNERPSIPPLLIWERVDHA